MYTKRLQEQEVSAVFFCYIRNFSNFLCNKTSPPDVHLVRITKNVHILGKREFLVWTMNAGMPFIVKNILEFW